jgi:hypothetical protein
MTTLDVKPKEGSSLVITVSFKDFSEVGFTPKTCVWSLTDTRGTVINGRTRVAATVTGTSHDFVLTGPDLAFAVGASKGNRIFTVEGTFDSTYGNDLAFRDEVGFEIINTVLDAV